MRGRKKYSPTRGLSEKKMILRLTVLVQETLESKDRVDFFKPQISEVLRQADLPVDVYTCYEKTLDIPVIPSKFEIYDSRVTPNEKPEFLGFEAQVDHQSLSYDLMGGSYSLDVDIVTSDSKIHKALELAGFKIKE